MGDLLTRARERAFWPVRAYLLLAWTWCRALAQYPVSLALMTLATSLGVFAEIGAVLAVFGHAGRLEGFSVAEGLLIAGMASNSFSCADMLLGNVENLGRHIRTGTLDVMLVRPVPPLVQMATDQFAPRRLGRIVPGAVVVAGSLAACDIEWNAARALILPVLLVSGTAICCSVWVLGACLQFFVADARQAANAITYGGQALTEYPLTVFGRDAVRAVTFVLPLAFVTWQPVLYLLDRPDPTGLPDALRHATPLVAVAMCLIAAVCWRLGLRHYRSTGS